MKTLVIKAAQMTPFVHGVGWDVAATPDGPIIIEANSKWGPIICQSFCGTMLTPEIRKDLGEFGLKFPG